MNPSTQDLTNPCSATALDESVVTASETSNSCSTIALDASFVATPGTSSSSQQPLLVRKRKKSHAENYPQNVRKQMKLRGLEFINCKGEVVPPREIKDSCGCKRRHCFERVSEEDRQAMRDRFRSFTSKDEQDNYAQSFVEATPVERRRQRPASECGNLKPKSISFKYFAVSNGRRVAVCKTALCNILTLTVKELNRLATLQSQGKAPKDNRGFAVPSHTKPVAVVNQLHEFMRTLPKKFTDNGQDGCIYLDSGLNVKILHKMFQEKYDPETTVSYSYFYKFYQKNYGFPFGRPEVDVWAQNENLTHLCSTTLTPPEQKVTEKTVDVNAANGVTEIKKEADIADEDSCSIASDCPQNFPMSHVSVQDLFYYQQLWANVFAFYNLKT